jgi:hypothetical protein
MTDAYHAGSALEAEAALLALANELDRTHGLDHPGRAPAQRHLPVAPSLDVCFRHCCEVVAADGLSHF